MVEEVKVEVVEEVVEEEVAKFPFPPKDTILRV